MNKKEIACKRWSRRTWYFSDCPDYSGIHIHQNAVVTVENKENKPTETIPSRAEIIRLIQKIVQEVCEKSKNPASRTRIIKNRLAKHGRALNFKVIGDKFPNIGTYNVHLIWKYDSSVYVAIHIGHRPNQKTITNLLESNAKFRIWIYLGSAELRFIKTDGVRVIQPEPEYRSVMKRLASPKLPYWRM